MGALDTLSTSMKSARGVSAKSFDQALSLKASGVSMVDTMSGGSNAFTDWQSQAKYRERYSLYRGWLYAAIDAIGHKAGSQPIRVGRMKGKDNKKPKGKKRHQPEDKKVKELSNIHKDRMTTMVRDKSAGQELEILENHSLIDILDNPNPIQGRWQFIYMFVANLALTGWGYVIRDVEGGRDHYYALPSTWVKPVHKEGSFSHFKLHNPDKPESQNEEDLLDAENVGFAYLPSPSDPKQAYAPTTAQLESIKINDYIQYSRQKFFERGVMPSVIVSVGRDPHPEVPGGVRPRLSPSQRRQVRRMVKSEMAGVANLANPAIVDGLIESIERLSMTDNEMGWDKSEVSVKRAILSTYCVHPYILGEEVGVGGYAQVANIEKRFFERVNSYLDMLSIVLTEFARKGNEADQSILVWIEKCVAVDPQEDNKLLTTGRKNGDVTKNEFRAKLGLPPDEDDSEPIISQSVASQVKEMIVQASSGKVPNDQAAAFFEGLGLPKDLATKLAGPKVPRPQQQVPGTPPGQQPGKPPAKPAVAPGTPKEQLEKAIADLRHTDYGNAKMIAQMILGQVEGMTYGA